MRAILLALCVATPAFADVGEAVGNKVATELAGFTAAADAFAVEASGDCLAGTLAPSFPEVMTAWMRVQHWRIGPMESGALAVAYWPDDRGFTGKQLAGMIADEDPVIDTAEGFTDVSIAGRGLFAAEMMIFDPAFNGYTTGDYSCRLTQRIAADIAVSAHRLSDEWDAYIPTLTTAGEAGNATYLSEKEVITAAYTQIMSTLETTTLNRVGRPLGTFERPRPKRAEAWRSGMSLQNILTIGDVAAEDALLLIDAELAATQTAVALLHDAATKVDDPTFANVGDDSSAWLKLEILGQRITGIHDAIGNEVGLPLGISAGFNSADGD